MLTAQQKQLCELQKEAVLIKGKMTPESSRGLEIKGVILEVNAENCSNATIAIMFRPL